MSKETDTDYRKLAIEASRSSFLAFLAFVWWMPQPLKIGRHTREMCELLTKAVFDWLDGKSTFLLMNMVFRHGKSDAVSRAFTPWFLGVCRDKQPDVILSGYGASLVESFSSKGRDIIESSEYQLVFPGVHIDPKRGSIGAWGVEGSAGTVTAAGLGGSLTGKGGHLIILDDYCKNREEAYSDVYREKTWQSFSVDLMSRQNAPASIVVVVATPWHPDDITGRIKKAMEQDPLFPKFKCVSFPAHKPATETNTGYEILFPEMYDKEWYDRQRATLGPTMAAALLDCNPVGEGTRMFRPTWFNTCAKPPERSRLNVYVLIDSANAKKKSSDFTTMWVVGLAPDRNYYVIDGIHDRLNLEERTRLLFELVEQWAPSCVVWEQIGAMSDVQHVREVQNEKGWHFPIVPLGQKVAKHDRIGWLVPVFEAGRIWFPHRILKKSVGGVVYDLVHDFLENEYSLYPATAHDDMLDDLANIQHPVFNAIASFPVTPGSEAAKQQTDRTTGDQWNPW